DKSGKQHRDEHYYRNAEKREYRNYNILTESIVMDRHHTEEDEEAGPNICNSQKHTDKGYLIECDKVGDDRKRDDEQGQRSQRIAGRYINIFQRAFAVKQRCKAPVRKHPK